MKYTANQYRELAKRFNSHKTEGKLLLIKMHPDIFKLEHHKEDWYMLRLVDEDAMEQELDFLFELENEIEKDKLTDLGL